MIFPSGILEKLELARSLPRGSRVALRKEELLWICREGMKIVKKEPILLEISPPLCVFGDLHGQYYDLMEIFGEVGTPPDSRCLFLGDYVDRGENSIETIAYLLALKINYPSHIWLLRGNHESPDVNQNFGFLEECETRYDIDVWNSFNELFEWLPLAAVIKDRIFCVHGGLSPRLSELSDISRIKRPLALPETGLPVDLLWSDPSSPADGWRENERGASYTYGPDTVDSFLARNNFDLLCRAHQMAENGVDFPFAPVLSTVTVFSARNYCGQYMNKGAVLKIGTDLRIDIKQFEPRDLNLLPS